MQIGLLLLNILEVDLFELLFVGVNHRPGKRRVELRLTWRLVRIPHQLQILNRLECGRTGIGQLVFERHQVTTLGQSVSAQHFQATRFRGQL